MDTKFDSSAIDDLIFRSEKCSCNCTRIEKRNDDELSCCYIFWSLETDNSVSETAAVEFIKETIFNIFVSFRFGLKHYPTWCRRIVGRTFVGHLSQFDGFPRQRKRNLSVWYLNHYGIEFDDIKVERRAMRETGTNKQLKSIVRWNLTPRKRIIFWFTVLLLEWDSKCNVVFWYIYVVLKKHQWCQNSSHSNLLVKVFISLKIHHVVSFEV